MKLVFVLRWNIFINLVISIYKCKKEKGRMQKLRQMLKFNG